MGHVSWCIMTEALEVQGIHVPARVDLVCGNSVLLRMTTIYMCI